MVKDSHSVQNITRQKIAYIGNLHENVKKIDIYELFGWTATTYLDDNCSVYMLQLQSNGRRKRYAYIKPTVYFQ